MFFTRPPLCNGRMACSDHLHVQPALQMHPSASLFAAWPKGDEKGDVSAAYLAVDGSNRPDDGLRLIGVDGGVIPERGKLQFQPGTLQPSSHLSLAASGCRNVSIVKSLMTAELRSRTLFVPDRIWLKTDP